MKVGGLEEDLADALSGRNLQSGVRLMKASFDAAKVWINLEGDKDIRDVIRHMINKILEIRKAKFAKKRRIVMV